jgi:hypothetical protein
MKRMKFILGCFLLLFIIACSSDQKRAENIVSKDIKSRLASGWAYFPVRFTELSDVLSNINDEDNYKDIKMNFDKVEYQYIYDSISYRESYKSDSIQYGVGFAELMKREPVSFERDELQSKLQDLKEKYTPYVVGRGFIHVYICNTPFGDSLYYSKYVFDDNMTIKNNYLMSFFVEEDSIPKIIESYKNDKYIHSDLNSDLWYY